jgi:hypothetical protein
MKIFVISYQRTGTTSTGQFFRDCRYKVASWDVNDRHKWTQKWVQGKYEDIFKSKDFNNYEVFEDDPWWCLDFYKHLFFKFPDSQFVLVERDSNKWFNSMLSRGNGKTLGNTYIHTKLYDREKEYHDMNIKPDLNSYDKLLPLDESHREKYTKIYETRNSEIKEFFNHNDNSRLINVKLEDNDKWEKIANHFKIKNYPKEVWKNKT